jgi:hypothetical protein
MDMKDEQGVSKREHLMQVINSSPEDSKSYESALEQLENISEIPFYIEHIWIWFWQISNGRSAGMSGPNALTWQDIKAWKDLLQVQIRPVEVEIIYEIDRAYLKYISDSNKKKKKGK